MTQSTSSPWEPCASLAVLRSRATLLQKIRNFFQHRAVLEVETPILSYSTTCDPFIDSFATVHNNQTYYLHTSPELPMKRLLAAGSGAIYQICKVFRQGESGPKHNPEFSLLEWYRPGYDLWQLMQEMDELLHELLSELPLQETCYYSYQQCFEQSLSINPHTANMDDLYQCAKGYNLHQVLSLDDEKDRWLDLLMSHVVEPNLGGDREHPAICFIYDYPTSQAALARVAKDNNGQMVAKRFEVYMASMELANGFYELKDGNEQQSRFESENQQRLDMGKEAIPIDQHFLQALHSGLPECSGVALGLDRVLMLLESKNSIEHVISFPIARA